MALSLIIDPQPIFLEILRKNHDFLEIFQLFLTKINFFKKFHHFSKLFVKKSKKPS
jgi:hypothetical protein